jgi:hypothetical protein
MQSKVYEKIYLETIAPTLNSIEKMNVFETDENYFIEQQNKLNEMLFCNTLNLKLETEYKTQQKLNNLNALFYKQEKIFNTQESYFNEFEERIMSKVNAFEKTKKVFVENENYFNENINAVQQKIYELEKQKQKLNYGFRKSPAFSFALNLVSVLVIVVSVYFGFQNSEQNINKKKVIANKVEKYNTTLQRKENNIVVQFGTETNNKIEEEIIENEIADIELSELTAQLSKENNEDESNEINTEEIQEYLIQNDSENLLNDNILIQ